MKTLDCRGLACPEPVLRTRAALASEGVTELLVIVDNEAARGNVSRYATTHGYAVAEGARDGAYYLTLTAATPAAQADHHTAADAPGAAGVAATGGVAGERAAVDGTVVLIGSSVFGRGDDTLGAKLMGSFLYALAEADRVPAEILFVNGGVRLTTGATPVKEHLLRLAERGSRIASCGTCLDFYGLKEQLVVGEVTNMYAIVESCQAATRVITL